MGQRRLFLAAFLAGFNFQQGLAQTNVVIDDPGKGGACTWFKPDESVGYAVQAALAKMYFQSSPEDSKSIQALMRVNEYESRVFKDSRMLCDFEAYTGSMKPLSDHKSLDSTPPRTSFYIYSAGIAPGEAPGDENFSSKDMLDAEGNPNHLDHAGRYSNPQLFGSCKGELGEVLRLDGYGTKSASRIYQDLPKSIREAMNDNSKFLQVFQLMTSAQNHKKTNEEILKQLRDQLTYSGSYIPAHKANDKVTPVNGTCWAPFINLAIAAPMATRCYAAMSAAAFSQKKCDEVAKNCKAGDCKLESILSDPQGLAAKLTPKNVKAPYDCVWGTSDIELKVTEQLAACSRLVTCTIPAKNRTAQTVSTDFSIYVTCPNFMCAMATPDECILDNTYSPDSGSDRVAKPVTQESKRNVDRLIEKEQQTIKGQ